jgi:hypothetical protein
LLLAKSRVYLAQGTEDKAVRVSDFEVLRAELPAGGRDVFARVLEWFLALGL